MKGRSSDRVGSRLDGYRGMIAVLALVALVLLSRQANAVIRDYDRQRKAGVDPVFDPEDVGIINAPVWKDIAARRTEKERVGRT